MYPSKYSQREELLPVSFVYDLYRSCAYLPEAHWMQTYYTQVKYT